MKFHGIRLGGQLKFTKPHKEKLAHPSISEFSILLTHRAEDISVNQQPVASQAHRLPRHLGPAVQWLLAEYELPSSYVSRGRYDPETKKRSKWNVSSVRHCQV